MPLIKRFAFDGVCLKFLKGQKWKFLGQFAALTDRIRLLQAEYLEDD